MPEVVPIVEFLHFDYCFVCLFVCFFFVKKRGTDLVILVIYRCFRDEALHQVKLEREKMFVMFRQSTVPQYALIFVKLHSFGLPCLVFKLQLI